MTNLNIRPHTAAWFRNMHKQGEQLTTTSPTGFPDLVAAAGLPDHDSAQAYPKDTLVFRTGSLYRSNSVIAAGTPFVEGVGPSQWTNVSDPGSEIEIYNPVSTYNTGDPVSHIGSIWRAKIDGLTGPFIAGSWERMTAPPMRVFLAPTDSDDLVVNGAKGQEIVFESDRTISGFTFLDGDRILLRANPSGTLEEAEFYYFPLTNSERPVPPTGTTDTVYVGNIPANASINIFYVFDPTFDYIPVGTNIADKIVWDNTDAPPADQVIEKIEWLHADSGTVETINPADYQINPGNRQEFMLMDSDKGAEQGDRFTVTFSTP